jgi:hypothetical protein
MEDKGRGILGKSSGILAIAVLLVAIAMYFLDKNNLVSLPFKK